MNHLLKAVGYLQDESGKKSERNDNVRIHTLKHTHVSTTMNSPSNNVSDSSVHGPHILSPLVLLL